MSSRAISGDAMMSQSDGVLGCRSPGVCIGYSGGGRQIYTRLRVLGVCHD